MENENNNHEKNPFKYTTPSLQFVAQSQTLINASVSWPWNQTPIGDNWMENFVIILHIMIKEYVYFSLVLIWKPILFANFDIFETQITVIYI